MTISKRLMWDFTRHEGKNSEEKVGVLQKTEVIKGSRCPGLPQLNLRL